MMNEELIKRFRTKKGAENYCASFNAEFEAESMPYRFEMRRDTDGTFAVYRVTVSR